MTSEQLLPVDEDSPKPCWQFLVSWRENHGNRKLFKVLTTCGLLANVGTYVYLRKDFLVMVIIGILWLLKNLVATWGQDTPTFLSPGTPFTLIVVYVMGIPSVLWMLVGCPASGDVSFPHRDVVGLALFIFGNAYSFAYETGRFRWKQKPENKGHCHTVGLASLCIHPNYFGDMFAYSGWALAGGTICALSLLPFQVFTFLWLIIPNSDAYLAIRYKDEFKNYAAKTAPLIPFVRSKLINQVLAWGCLVVCIYMAMQCSEHCPAK